jgi:hypothetical protein
VTDSFYAQGKILSIDTAAMPASIVRQLVVTKNGKPAAQLDLEGVAARPAGGFWLASEENPERKDNPTESLLIRVSARGDIEEEISLPDTVKSGATRFGFEGVAVTGQGDTETVWLDWRSSASGRTMRRGS